MAVSENESCLAEHSIGTSVQQMIVYSRWSRLVLWSLNVIP